MKTTTKTPTKAYAVFGTDFSGADHHLGDVVARSAREAVRDAKTEYGHRCRDFTADRIHLAEIEDDDLRAAMAEWMDRNGVESR